MKRFFYFPVLLIVLLQSHFIFASSDTVTYAKDSITFSGTTIAYRKATIGTNIYSPSLVVYLHGGSSRGNDNEKQLLEPAVDSIANYLVDNNINAIFLVPQCPQQGGWLGKNARIIRNMIQREVTANAVDTNKIYIFGGSMGGTGTWNMVNLYPHLFAAAMPVAGNPSACSVDSVSQTPIYTVMGTEDNIMSIDVVVSFVDSLQFLDSDVRFDIEEGWTHENTCIKSYTQERLAWIFSHGNTLSNLDDLQQFDKITFSLFPNPTTESVTLKMIGSDDVVLVQILDDLGKEVYNQTIAPKQTNLIINTHYFAKGIYYVRIIADNMEQIEKLVVK